MSQDIKKVDTSESFSLASWKFGFYNLKLDEKIYSQPRQPGIAAEDILR